MYISKVKTRPKEKTFGTNKKNEHKTVEIRGRLNNPNKQTLHDTPRINNIWHAKSVTSQKEHFTITGQVKNS